MPRNITVTFQDGSTHVYQNAPDDVTPEQVAQRAQQQFGKAVTALDGGKAAQASRSLGDEVRQQVGNLAAGAVRGAGSIGATLLYPVDKLTDMIKGDREQTLSDLVAGKKPMSRNEERRAAMDEALRTLGADTDSLAFKGGKLAGEIAGTAGAGGAVANTLARVPGVAAAAPNFLTAVRTAGMTGGNPLVRAAGGAVTGGVSAGMVNPDEAGAGAVIGGALPGALQVAGKAGNAIGDAVSGAMQSQAKKLMQSAIKPTIKQLKTGEADSAVQTLLDYGISPTKKGVEQLRDLIDAKNAEIAGEIASSGATIDKNAVLNRLNDVRAKFGAQVSPSSDLSAIQQVADDFAAHPSVPQAIPVAQAQELKQGTYRVLKDKFGQLGTADTEAQKALARGLKEEIATQVPAVGPLNAEESRLLQALSVSERRALMDANKNPMGLAALATNPVSWAAFMADRSAAFKAMAARMANRASSAQNPLAALAANPAAQQIAYRAAPVVVADQ